MKSMLPLLRLLCLLVAAAGATHRPANAEENAACDYFLAALELRVPMPGYVESATTDSPSFGFGTPLSAEQNSYLRRQDVVAVLARFDHATNGIPCTWGRYATSNWSDAGLNDRLHGVARLVLLRARLRYESGEWAEANHDVERVRILARHMTLQTRPWEHQPFMIENMAVGTAAAYLLRLPQEALTDLATRDGRVGLFMPMSRMLEDEAARLRALATAVEAGQAALDPLLACLAYYGDAVPRSRQSLPTILQSARTLSVAIDRLAKLVDDRNVVAADRAISKLFDPIAGGELAPASLSEWGRYELRENSQAICRGEIFRSVLGKLQQQSRDFATLADPYGDGHLELHRAGSAFVLYSDLVHSSRIDFRFGLAGRKEHANHARHTQPPAVSD